MENFELVENRIEDLASGQILSHFKFYEIQSEKGFSVFKNDFQLIVIVYKSKNEKISFLETLSFTSLSKLELFYFLINHSERDGVLRTIEDIVDIEVYTSFNFEESVSVQKLINSYFNLESSDQLADTPLENITYSRNGKDCVLFYKNEKPIDIVTFEENGTTVYSEFGNNFGIHIIKQEKSENLLLSFDPNVLLDKRILSYNIILSKYFPSITEILTQIDKLNIKKIYFTVNSLNASFYRLYFILEFLNFYEDAFYCSIRKSPNTEFIELQMNLKGELQKKIELMNFFAELKNEINSMYSGASEKLLSVVKNQFNFDFSILSKENNHVANIVFRNKKELIMVLSEKFIKKFEKSCIFPFQIGVV